jgi:hypothetical protein
MEVQKMKTQVAKIIEVVKNRGLRAPAGNNTGICIKLPTDMVVNLRATADRESRSLSGQIAYYLRQVMVEKPE